MNYTLVKTHPAHNNENLETLKQPKATTHRRLPIMLSGSLCATTGGELTELPESTDG